MRWTLPGTQALLNLRGVALKSTLLTGLLTQGKMTIVEFIGSCALDRIATHDL